MIKNRFFYILISGLILLGKINAVKQRIQTTPAPNDITKTEISQIKWKIDQIIEKYEIKPQAHYKSHSLTIKKTEKKLREINSYKILPINNPIARKKLAIFIIFLTIKYENTYTKIILDHLKTLNLHEGSIKKLCLLISKYICSWHQGLKNNSSTSPQFYGHTIQIYHITYLSTFLTNLKNTYQIE